VIGGLGLLATLAVAQEPYGLDDRHPIGPYLNGTMPSKAGAFAFPPALSATGAFSDLQTLTPAAGLIPFGVNSPLWSDAAIKSRWMAVPNDGPPYSAHEQIGFAPVGEWTFPDGTVFVKHFELTVNEGTGERKRLETRLLVRNSDGAVYGVTYKWRPDQRDADLLPDGLEEDIAVTSATGATRIQRYSYPSRADCLFCHSQPANYVLGPKTHQLNGDFTYPATARTANQLRTLNHLALLNPAPSEASFATYLRSVAVSNITAPVEHRMRSWVDANCSHCHRPGGFGPGYDGRFYTPIEKQNLINTYVRFRDLDGSQLYQRDNALDELKMPPIAKNLVHQTAMATLRQWVASPLEMLSVHLHQDASHLIVRFNSHIDPQSATDISNYAIEGAGPITEAAMAPEADTVILTLPQLVENQNYVLITQGIRDTALSANTIWPGSRESFVAKFAVQSPAGRLANISARVHVAGNDRVLIGGFIARGGIAKRVMLRAIGPSLPSTVGGSVLADPVIELFDSSGKPIAANDNWEDNANRQEIIDTGIAPTSLNESAIVRILPASAAGVPYTIVMRGAGGTSGIGLIEVYDLDPPEDSALANLSSRGFVQTGDNVMIGGVIITGAEPRRTIVRAIGPTLPLDERLVDPLLGLYDGEGNLLQSNDNWRSDQEAEIVATTIAPSNDFEAAIVRTLPPGPYTAIVRGANNTSGVALVEAYALD